MLEYRIKSLLLMGALAALVASLGYLLFGLATGAILLIGAVLLNWLSLARTRRAILWLHRARPLRRWEAPLLFDIARDLAERAGLAQVPLLMVYPSDMPNAFALATGREPPVIAASNSLLRILQPSEIRGVLAHEFAHLKNGDSVFSLASGIFVQVITALSQGFSVLLLLLALTGGLEMSMGALLATLLFLGAAPSAATLLQAGLMRTRERLADREAAELTGDPRSLAAALHKLQQYSRYLSGWLRRFRFIYTSEDEGGARLLRSHPPTEERVRDLLALDRGYQATAVRRIPVTRPRHYLVA